MPTLLVKLQGNRSLNRTIHPPRLYVYDNKLVYRKRNFIKVREFSIPYNQISQVNIINGIFFAEIVVLTTGVEYIKIRYVSKSKTKLAKKIIDQKMYDLHYGDKNKREDPEMMHYTKMVNEFENGLSRLNELISSHKITKKEFIKKRKALLKKLK